MINYLCWGISVR